MRGLGGGAGGGAKAAGWMELALVGLAAAARAARRAAGQRSAMGGWHQLLATSGENNW